MHLDARIDAEVRRADAAAKHIIEAHSTKGPRDRIPSYEQFKCAYHWRGLDVAEKIHIFQKHQHIIGDTDTVVLRVAFYHA